LLVMWFGQRRNTIMFLLLFVGVELHELIGYIRSSIERRDTGAHFIHGT
jgi:hypothetical protein